jgi:hypothetical protein
MAHLYGWIHIEDFQEGSRKVEQMIESLKKPPVFIEKTIMNAVHMVNISACHNHFGDLECEIIQFFHEMATLVDSESYGLLYIYDDEGTNGHPDHFKVYRLAKNGVSEHSDSLLSPYSEKIADYSEE